MGDTTLAGTGGGAHAVEGGITHGPENAIHRRLSTRLAGHTRAVRTLGHIAQDRLQVDRALPSPRAGRPGGALAPAAPLAESDGRGNRDGDPRRSATPSGLGWQETPRAAAQAPSPVAPPRALHRVRHPEPPRDGAYPTPAAPHRASGQADESDSGAQRCLECRLQGTVPDGRRPLLLSPDGDRWVQSLSLELPGAELHGRRRREARLYPAVSGVWPAHADPHGQRRAVCHHDLGPALEALGLVGAPGCPPRVHRAGASRSEWAA